MNIWDLDKLVIFIAFVIPGFVSIKIYDLLVPTDRKEIGKYLIDAVAYSCINYALVSWILVLADRCNLYKNHPFWFFLLVISILFLFPILWAVLYYCLRTLTFFTKRIPHPISKPWDYVFSKREAYWVIVYLNDGTKIGGRYGSDSFASSYPADEQIYLQQVWEVNDDNRFLKAVERSKGILVSKKDIKAIEFFR